MMALLLIFTKGSVMLHLLKIQLVCHTSFVKTIPLFFQIFIRILVVNQQLKLKLSLYLLLSKGKEL
jgi:hypothetical protein